MFFLLDETSNNIWKTNCFVVFWAIQGDSRQDTQTQSPDLCPPGQRTTENSTVHPFLMSLSFPLPSLLASPALQPGDHTGRNRSVMLGGGPYFLRGGSKDYHPSCLFYSLWWMMDNVNQALIWLCFIFTKYFHIYYPTHHSYPKPARLAGTPLYR